MDVERLIECVKDHVYLYDTKHRDYKNFVLKTAVWEAIAKDLRQTCDAVKLKWKTIRDGYIKYKKQLKDSAVSGKRIYDYVWKSQMEFLDKHSVSRNSKANQSSQNQEDSPGDSTIYSPKLAEAHTSQESQSPFEVMLETRPKRKAEGDIDKILSYLVKKKEKKYDAVDYLFMSYAETFKNFSIRTQTEMKLELANIFLNAELKEIQNAETLQKSTAKSQSGSDSYSSSSDSDNDNSQSQLLSSMNVKVERSESPEYNEHQF